ncbi:hypothetical protein [Streptomyces sp. NBC_00120]|uniref:Uncharacterized protein n=1 Tax=Streptomyces sp. NBC_00119 TaxID=2975659 RepID=A0AAU1U4S3_9ACTN|nr:hypothetical protein [Streptomyces sp. NBC_00120]MCX5321763.1 hypothetical protein [Streptomyces sp. NBC_00120]
MSTITGKAPTSFAETAKNWYRKHKPKIRVVGGVTLAVGLAVVAHLAERCDAERCDAESYDAESYDAERCDAEDIADSEPVSDRETTGEPRQSPSPHLRKLPEGQNASEEKKAQYKEATGDDLAPGTTWVHPPEDEDPGEAAA